MPSLQPSNFKSYIRGSINLQVVSIFLSLGSLRRPSSEKLATSYQYVVPGSNFVTLTFVYCVSNNFWAIPFLSSVPSRFRCVVDAPDDLHMNFNSYELAPRTEFHVITIPSVLTSLACTWSILAGIVWKSYATLLVLLERFCASNEVTEIEYQVPVSSSVNVMIGSGVVLLTILMPCLLRRIL